MKTVRIWFRKIGTAKYISHLDLNRCMARAMRRAAIPAWVTEGFNPHLFLTFALPLSLGQEGLDESMDIKLADDAEIDDIPAKLNATLPAGSRRRECTPPFTGAVSHASRQGRRSISRSPDLPFLITGMCGCARNAVHFSASSAGLPGCGVSVIS